MGNRDAAEDLLSIAAVNRTSAVSILSSITPNGPETRLDTIYAIFPKMVMVERNRHRQFSLSDRSSRAVPPEKLIEEIRTGVGLAMPARFRKRAKGMGGGEDLSGDELIQAQLDWIEDALNAADSAERASLREAKETVNRRIDPYIYSHTLMSSTRDGWLNFFGLRLDSGADPTIQLLAQKCFQVYKTAKLELLESGQWHLPFVESSDWDFIASPTIYRHVDIAKRLSAARCAHLSYNDLETGKRMTIDRALAIYDKLVTSRPIHPSPTEHQATPDTKCLTVWLNPSWHGNLFGWVQARKLLSGEAVAALPDGYDL